MSYSNKIMPPDEIIAWRQKAAGSDGMVAVVCGSFDILQPGNLFALRQAARSGLPLCVVVDADEDLQNRSWAWNSASVRAEGVTHLKGVSRVLCLTSPQARSVLSDLRPYKLYDCLARPAVTALHQAARELAAEKKDMDPLDGCFSQDISDAILNNVTPVRLAEHWGCRPFDLPELEQFCNEHNEQKLVTVNGCFDILHLGHLRFLQQARAMGDELCVLVNDDESVRAYKGATRPVFPIAFRLAALEALESVTRAVPFSGDTPLDLLARIRPRIHVKGGTYEPERVRAEQELLAGWGGEVRFCPLLEGYSTTSLIDKAR